MGTKWSSLWVQMATHLSDAEIAILNAQAAAEARKVLLGDALPSPEVLRSFTAGWVSGYLAHRKKVGHVHRLIGWGVLVAGLAAAVASLKVVFA